MTKAHQLSKAVKSHIA